MGRPKKYTDVEIIEKAMDYFWSFGYGSTSLNDLAKSLNLGKASLYNSFGSKKELFKRAVDHYGNTAVERNVKILEGASDGKGAIESLLLSLANKAALAEQFRGCLLVNSMSELGLDREERQWVSDCIERMRASIVEALGRGVKDGTLPALLDIEGASFTVLCTMQGMRLLARHGVPTEHLHGCAKNCVNSLISGARSS